MQKITTFLFQEILSKTSQAPRARMSINFHDAPEAIYHRMLTCLMPETYIRPHRHLHPSKDKSLIIIEGIALFIEFDDDGNKKDYFILNRERGNWGVDIRSGTWHTIIALSPCLLFDAKEGPYSVLDQNDWAIWAPEEGTFEANIYKENLKNQFGF